MANDVMTEMSMDIDYFKKAVEEIRPGLRDHNDRIRDIELTQERHKTYFMFIGATLTTIVGFLAGAASGLVSIFR